MTQWVKKLPAVQETQETWVQSPGEEDPLEEGMATHSSILALRNPMNRGEFTQKFLVTQITRMV